MMLLSGWLHYGSAWEALKNEGRGILLSSGVAIAGLIPASFSHGIGSEIARPFAVMIIGGLSSSLVFTLVLLPAILARAELKK
jgi:cobalt-zinc-cadmium resistance protein CzcA